MAIAIALVIIVVASVLFHFLSPWWATPLASNWKQMDDTLTITLVITGLFFVVINLLVGYIVWRFRHREGHRAPMTGEPETGALADRADRRGIIALLAPGLIVYADYVRPPRDAMVMEVVGQQWQWAFRFPAKVASSVPRIRDSSAARIHSA
jgi:cytochrome c oxidase subunit 2